MTARASGARCPVCAGRSRPLLALAAQQIYQHPVAADAVVPEPHTIDLRWVACVDCAHGWQPEFDAGLLERIYRQHYYTPAPDGLAVQFRDDFLSAVDGFGLAARKRAVLEIGASDGGVLAAVWSRTGAERAIAFEPDARNAALARQRGLDVREQFFGAASAAKCVGPVDLAYARHVIEHVFDFADFFAGLDAATAADAHLVLETPALDHHAGTEALHPFHVEHVHVFSASSLARLCRIHGWGLLAWVITGDGNLIAAFRREESAGGGRVQSTPVPAPPALDALQGHADAHRARMRQLLGDRWLVFWGAGSASIRLANLIARPPDVWTDGNPAKIGMRFVGQSLRMVPPEAALAAAKAREGEGAVIVIASSFVREILPRIRALGWAGPIVDLSGNRL